MSEGPMPQDHLVRIAESIVVGGSVDWAAEARSSEPAGAAVLKQLQLLESIAAAHRDSIPSLAATVASGSDTTGQPASGTWGPLHLRVKLGQGSFGEVYRAYDPSLEREVALKLVRPNAGHNDPNFKRFLSEARRMARVRHPNVLVIHGVDLHEGRAGFWTDLLEGRTLEDYFQQEGTIGAREAALIAVDLCHALAAVHKAGVIHRDVKPSNIMRESGGRVVLMDFGSGGDLFTGGKPDQSDHAYGTPLCMAPEQLGGHVAGPPTDIYAIGVLLYRAVSGSYPVMASNFQELAKKHAAGESVPLRDRRPDLPTDFVRIVDRALNARPEERYQSAGQMERALLSTLGSAAPELSPGSFTARKRPARTTALLALGAAALLVTTVVLLRSYGRRPTSDTPSMAAGARTPAATTVPRTSAISATAALFRERAGKTERLLGGSRVRLGDDVYLTLQSPEPVYAYVLNEDEHGDVFVLFPVLGLTPTNPLPAGTQHRIPGRLSGEEVNWEVTVAGGREQILVLASRGPLTELENEISKFSRAVPGAPIQYGHLSSRAVGTLRGFGGFSKRPEAKPESTTRLADVLRNVSGTGADPASPWVWEMALENPSAR